MTQMHCHCTSTCSSSLQVASPPACGKRAPAPFVSTARQQQVLCHRERAHSCRAQATEDSGQRGANSSGPLPQQAELPNKQSIALAAVSLGAAAFLLSRFSGGAATLGSLEKTAVPFDTALANGKPSLLEFYANWCETCRESAPEVFKAEQAVKDRVNLVMLNIDNPKWSPEAAQYRVRGIPHFVFLDGRGRQLGTAIGRFPQSVLNENLEALAKGVPLPFTKASGAVSPLAQRSQKQQQQLAPRSHSTS